MKQNIGSTDKYVRLVFGVVLILLVMGCFVTGLLANIAIAAAGIIVVTAMINFCPLYALFGLSSKKGS